MLLSLLASGFVLPQLLASGFVLPQHAPSTTDQRIAKTRVGGLRLSEGEQPRRKLESPASIAAEKMKALARTYNPEEEKALRTCRIEFAPYPAGKYNKIASEDEGLGREAAFEQVRKDLPALASWSDDEIEATYTLMKVRERTAGWIPLSLADVAPLPADCSPLPVRHSRHPPSF